MTLFKNLLYCYDTNTFHENYDLFLSNTLIAKNKKIKKYFEDLKSSETEWAHTFRKTLLLRGHNTNNICERAFLRLKDRVLNRQKCTNVVQLAEYVAKVMTSHYQRIILTKISFNQSIPKQLKKSSAKAEHVNVKVIDNDTFFANDKYIVNTSLGVCSCPVGCTGSFCKHQIAVYKKYNAQFQKTNPLIDSSDKELLYHVATGENNLPAGFYGRSIAVALEMMTHPEMI